MSTFACGKPQSPATRFICQTAILPLVTCGAMLLSAGSSTVYGADLVVGGPGAPTPLTISNGQTISEGSNLIVGYGVDNDDNPYEGTLNIVTGADILLDNNNGATNNFEVGFDGGTGIVEMTDGAVTLQTSGSSGYNRLRVGSGAGSTGTFNQSSGVVDTDIGSFNIGFQGGTGTYNLSGDAELHSGGVVHIGRGISNNSAPVTTGTLEITGDSTFNLIQAEGRSESWLYVGRWHSEGTINQNGADSEVTLQISSLLLGTNGNDDIGNETKTAQGHYNLVDGTLTVNASYVELGQSAESVGTFTQSGGTSSFGSFPGSTQKNAIIVGNKGEGVFTVEGGTSTVDNGIRLAHDAGSEGRLVVRDLGVLVTGGDITGGAGTAEFTLEGGTLGAHTDATEGVMVSVAPELAEGTTSTFDTNGNSIALSEGFTGTGGFRKTGAGALILGGESDLAGSSSVEQGDLAIGGPGAATGALTVNTDLNVEGGSNLIVGSSTGHTGTLTIENGTAEILLDNNTGATNNFEVGFNGGTGIVNMSGGSVTLQTSGSSGYNRLRVGSGAGSTGAFNQSGGVVDTDVGSFNVGFEGGTGVYNLSGDAELHSGAVVHIGRGIRDNDTPVTTGILNVAGSSTFELIQAEGRGDSWLYVGRWHSEGTMTQSGEDSKVELQVSGFILGSNIDSNGTKTAKGSYDLNGGTLAVKASYVRLGESVDSIGTFTQGGGTSSFESFPGSTQKNAVIVGDKGEGIFTLEDGTSTLHNGMLLASAADSRGTLNLRGGTLEVGGENGLRKGGGTAEVHLEGGTLSATGSDLTSSLDMTLDNKEGETDTVSTVRTADANASLSGVLSGEGSLKKEGAGTLTLAGGNTYTGTTDITAGTLIVAGTGSTGTGAVTIGVGATLAGTGLVKGATTIEGALKPGNSPGNLTFAQDLTLAGGSTTTLEIAGIGADQYDTLTLQTGVLTLGGTLELDFTQSFDQAFNSNLFALEDGVTVEGNFSSVSLTGIYGPHSFDPDAGNATLWTLDLGGRTFMFDASSGSFDVAAIPEPGTWALLASGAAGLWLLRRRRMAGL